VLALWIIPWNTVLKTLERLGFKIKDWKRTKSSDLKKFWILIDSEASNHNICFKEGISQKNQIINDDP